MAHHHSALRQHRRSLRRRAINKKNKAALRTEIKKLREAIRQPDKEAAHRLLPRTTAAVDKSIKKGTIHKNKGSRIKSRLSRQVLSISPSPSE